MCMLGNIMSAVYPIEFAKLKLSHLLQPVQRQLIINEKKTHLAV